MVILGIETSCDETAAAVVRGPGEAGVELLASVVASQDDLHAHFGGIVPEVASRRHIEMIVPVIREAMARAGAQWDDVDAIAVTVGPGLIGSLVVGVAAAKALAVARDRSLVGVHHLEGHMYSAAVGSALPLPAVFLIASGGHSHLVLMRDHGLYEVLGRTRDDAPGEAFDKGARLLGLPYPGGPLLAELADSYSGRVEPLPRARIPHSLDFSFSGVKTALARRVQGAALDEEGRARVAAAYQESIVLSLAERAAQAAEETGFLPVIVVGGVARNRRLRELLSKRAEAGGLRVLFPEPGLCTDNGAMVAAAGAYKLALSGASQPDLECAANLPLANWVEDDSD
ncbi:MAG TPA: tRNA (adenosine(37)-N6)-threonylcarbamoyltransferase complex transferase subunit TsaD [Armatimonadota bacterium]|nr:tRNA (adenosine(37)-N6)-threonylcarbamoyltransferase complex transferase subunit TsaD [Armatimonadota bacterium]